MTLSSVLMIVKLLSNEILRLVLERVRRELNRDSADTMSYNSKLESPILYENLRENLLYLT